MSRAAPPQSFEHGAPLGGRKQRAAIIGFGGMGQRHYKACLSAGIEVAAVCDLNEAVVRRAAPDFGGRVFPNHEALLAAGSYDVVSVVSNGPTHAAIAAAAAEAGVPRILCEKPMATSLADARRLLETCRRTGARLAVNHIRRYSPAYARLKSALAAGAVGRLRHIYFHSGSTGLGNFVIHAFDLMRFLFDDEPAWVSGLLDKTGTANPRGAQFRDPAGFGTIGFAGGARGMVDSAEDTGVQYLFVLAGEYGRVLIDELNGRWEIRARAAADRALGFTRYGTAMPPAPFETPEPFDIVDLTARALKNLLSDEPVRSTGEDGLKALEMVMAFHVSDGRDGARVALPLPESEWGRDVPIA